jgi:hypothetical protein
MALNMPTGAPTLVLTRDAFERVGLTRSRLDGWLNLTADEFRVERGLVAIGPVHDTDAFTTLVEELERRGLVYFDDFFELSGNWPAWLKLYATAEERG